MDNPWVSEDFASLKLGVPKSTLKKWREIGYLRPGTHWRSAPENQLKPWKPSVIYHLRWCTEVLNYWKQHDAPIENEAA